MKKKLLVPCIIVTAVFFFPVLFRILPFKELTEFQNQEYSTRIYDRDGNLIQVTALKAGGRREYTPIKQIPKSVQKEFIKQEDHRFYFHHGIDWIAIAGAIIQNKKSGKIVRGGSTITMQLAKSINKSNAKTFTRKFKDILIAWRLEAKLSKKQILELYLNSIYLGAGNSGVTSGARTYFGCELDKLTQGQIEVLSILPRNSSYYNPVEHPNRYMDFSEEAYQAAQQAHFYKYELNMPHFVNYLKSDKAGIKDKNGRLPYEIHTTASLEIYSLAQNFLMQALSEASDARIANGSLLLIDNRDNSVLAWIGNGNFFDEYHSGQVDGVLVTNQPGSSMKPFLYALGIEKELITPSTILKDIPMEFGSEKLYIPENFNNRFNGPIRTRIALASSLNIPAVALLDTIGVDDYLEQLYSMGFESLRKTGKNADLGLALGAGEVSLYELVPAFSSFVHDGYYMPLFVIQGQANPDSVKPVYSIDTARLICSILSDKGARSLGFGYSQTFQTEYPSIFKTGTSNQYQDIVALGATKDFTIGVWMGNFSGQTVVGKTGSSLPAWVARNIFDYLERQNINNPELIFPEPEHWHKKEICPVSGLKPSENCPTSIYEYIKDEDLPEYEKNVCTWHNKVNNQITVIYPPEYQQWARINDVQGLIEYTGTNLTIVSPKNNSLFYYSSQNSDLQAIPFEVIGGSDNELIVEYDGRYIKKVARPFIFFLPVERGSHICTVNCGSEKQQLFFEVK